MAVPPQARDNERPSSDTPRARPKRGGRGHSGLLITGIATFATSYIATALVAAMVSAIRSADCEAGNITEGCNTGELMLIPLVGPIVAGRDAAEWVLLAGPQILGATMIVLGAAHYSSSKKRRRWQAFEIYPMPLRDGGLLAARLRF